MRCCGKEVMTPFCPNCGKSWNVSSLHGLLVHVTRQASEIRKRANNRREWLQDKDAHADEEGYARKAEMSAQKWEAWRDSLSELISKDLSQ
jgi:RNA polymerase subunit RPABC4/transcription elongation factor Spt4